MKVIVLDVTIFSAPKAIGGGVHCVRRATPETAALAESSAARASNLLARDPAAGVAVNFSAHARLAVGRWSGSATHLYRQVSAF